MKKAQMDINALRVTTKILKKLQTYAMMDMVKPYQTASICMEIGSEHETCMAAVRHLVDEGLLEENNGSICLAPFGADDDLILPEELLYKPRFQGLFPAALDSLDPSKGGNHFHRNIFVIAAFDAVTEKLRRYIRQVCA